MVFINFFFNTQKQNTTTYPQPTTLMSGWTGAGDAVM